jgi:hypothetical protein
MPRPKPEKKPYSMNLRLDADLYLILKNYAKSENKKINRLINDVTKGFLVKEGWIRKDGKPGKNCPEDVFHASSDMEQMGLLEPEPEPTTEPAGVALPSKWEDCISHEQLIQFYISKGKKYGAAYYKAQELGFATLSREDALNTANEYADKMGYTLI